ncbi:hypothetical protein [Planctomycetes bacterium K23_9]|uniref:Uncharacterized protein n=1 Tax=Stieleria marina TaxID=1930275 RepID=A0A517NQC5_9BACT|nr:hypothetical protein K239x_12730 [Planctomycetes bacterium K23_9]
MLKRILFAVAPLMLVATSVMAEDNLMSRLAKLDVNDAAANAAEVADADDFGQADVDALLGDDEDKSSEDAVAACFRRVGYGYNYCRSYNSYSNYRYHNYYTPVYHSYRYCAPTYHYTPVTYSYYTPVYTSYWGCW